MWDIKNLNMDDVLENKGIGPILANFNSNYRIPVRYPDVVQIKTRITHIGNSSFGIEHEMYSKNNGSKIVFDAKSVVVMVDYKNEGKVQLDSDSKKTLEAFM